MKNSALITFLLTALIICVAVSCKKSNGISIGNSRIVYVNYTNTNGQANYYRIVYDGNNNVDSIINTGGGSDTGHNGFLALNYLNSSFSITDENNNSNIVDINTSLQIDTIFSTGTNYTFMLYNGSQIGSVNVNTPISAYPYYMTSITDYTYSNGDIAAVNATGAAETYDYDQSKSGQIGDPQRITEFLDYGRAYTQSAHLATDMYLNGTWQEKYFYNIDSYGRIQQMTRVINNGTGGTNDTAYYVYGYNL